ncbi:arylsulfatase B-like [Phlebotomus argentipes]|uniref:arylsulfatase B-like n=1 Tax=Phlebotomus argentipes TaxID=94469 RepID=UPI0028931850|nr:arylsulfatase B-like [Phlebotomus argentipes]
MEHRSKVFKFAVIFLLLVPLLIGIVIWASLSNYVGENVQKKPNIILIMADDLGSHDVSLRGSNQILTPNIDALGYQGVIFNRHYTAPMCTPTRSSLLTGKYSIHTGMQHYIIAADQPWCLPLEEKLLPQYLKEAGYKTHIAGKWHLGMAKKAFTPTHRGFDSHVGSLGPYIDYFNFTHWMSIKPYTPGFDFRYNESVYRDRVGEYATDVLADEASKIIYNHDPSGDPLFLYFSQLAPHAANDVDPVQAIPEDLEKVGHIKDPKRRTYAAMVKALDRSVGTVVKALKEKGMLENSIIVFFSDNGGPTKGFVSVEASNYPLKGQKNSPWEGALRGMALVWSPLLQQRHRVSEHLTHITDWLPTFAQIAGSTSIKSAELDGFDIWETLSFNKPPVRREMVHCIDPIIGYSSVYLNGWKYINGTTFNGRFDDWLGEMPFEEDPESLRYPHLVMESEVWRALNPFARRHMKSWDLERIRKKTKIVCEGQNPISTPCEPLKSPCLFHVASDPCEVSNLAHVRSSEVETIENKLRLLLENSVPPGNLPNDPRADPALNQGLWTWWLDSNQVTEPAIF